MTAALSVTATFGASPQTVTVSLAGQGSVASSPAGITCPGDCSEPYAQGTLLSLTATPATGWGFGGWTGACTGGSTTCPLTVDTAKSVTARFDPPLTVTKAGDGSGTISGGPISCGATCSAPVPFATPITLAATPATGSQFVRWTAGCSGSGPCTLSPSAPTTVTAQFGISRTLTVRITSPSGLDAVSVGDPINQTCGASVCSFGSADGEILQLHAIEDVNSVFSHWAGSCLSAGSSLDCQISVTASQSATAVFCDAADTCCIDPSSCSPCGIGLICPPPPCAISPCFQ
jgi:hypothetical protein